MNKLKKQFKAVKEILRPKVDIHRAFVEMAKLLKYFNAHLEKQKLEEKKKRDDSKPVPGKRRLRRIEIKKA